MAADERANRVRGLWIGLRRLVRRVGIGTVTAFVAASGRDQRSLASLAGNGRGLVLNLHAVTPRPSRFSPALSPDVLDELLHWLGSRSRIIALAELDHLDLDGDAPFVVLSFDDGYRDFLDYAVPVLARHGIVANQNVVPACVESGYPPDNVHLLDVVERLPLSRLRALPGPGADVGLACADPVRYAVAFSNWVKSRPSEQAEQLWAQLAAALPELEGPPLRPMLTIDQVRQLVAVHEIGAHSYDHRSMGVESDEAFRADLDRCDEWFRRELGRPASVYAFPNGSYRDSQIRIALGRGVEHVLLVEEQPTAAADPVRRRVTTFGDSAAEVRMRLARVV